MKYASTLLLALTFGIANAQNSSLIIKMKEDAPISAYIYLNKGTTLIPVDSIMLGRKIFSFNTSKYKPGVYSFVLSEDMYARFIVNNENVELSTSLEGVADSLKVIKSEENKVYYTFLKERERYNKEMESISTLLKLHPKKDRFSKNLAKEKKSVEQQYNNTLRDLINSKGNLLASKIILAELPVKAPENLSEAEKHQYLISNWWSSFPFEESHLINTPSISDKLLDYIDLYYVDGASREEQTEYFRRAVDEVLNQPGITKEMADFFKSELIKTFSQSSYDALIEYIHRNYPSNSSESTNIAGTEMDRLISLSTGKPAPDFDIKTDSLKTTLHKLNNNGTVIIFWSMECSHCRKMLPEINRYANDFKKQGIDVVAINLDAYRPAWKAFIKSSNFSWINMNIPNPYNSMITASYNVSGTPLIFVVDKDKNIYDKPADVKTLIKTLNKMVK